MADWLVPSISLAGVIMVSAANYFIQRWRYRIDRLSASVDGVCAEINTAANLATKYWLLDLAQKAERTDAAKMESELVGIQLRLQELLTALQGQDQKLDLSATEQSLAEFYDAITGGDFKARDRPPNNWQLQQTQYIAAKLNGELRSALNMRARKWL